MSLEESMKELAESNLKLAKSFDRYADVIQKFGLKIENDNAGKTPAGDAEPEEKPAGKAAGKGKPAGKAAGKPAAGKGDDDGFGDEEEKPAGKAKKLTHDDVKAKLLEIRDAAEDKEPALAIIREYGYDSIPTIKEKDYAAIFADAEKWLEDNAG